MKTQTFLVVLAALVVGTAIGLVLARPGGGELRVEKPEWMQRPESESPALPEAARVEAPLVPLRPAEPTGLGEMAAEGKLAKAMTDAKVPMRFTATALIDAGIAKDVVDSMVEILDRHYADYRRFKDAGQDNASMRATEVLLGVWPDLGKLIASGVLKPQITARAPSPRPTLWWFRDDSAKTLTASFPTAAGWEVRITFTRRDDLVPDLFDRAFEGVSTR